ncbi:MAG TPA: peptidylprolyl isomerase [Symbiobacteriaceae bacterium]|nr:peptidylprolyl isomerase [Symbiobacteriaceae bacterium]
MKRWWGTIFLVGWAVALSVGCAAPKLGENTLAVVNGRPITRAEFDTRLKIFALFYGQPVDDPARKQQVLDQMVRDMLIREQAGPLGVAVADEEVEAEMARFFGSLDRQYKSREAVNGRLQELNLTNDAIAAFLREFLLSQKIVSRKRSEVTVAEDEMRTFYEQKQDELYTFGEDVVRAAHILVPMDQESKAQEIAAKAKAGGDFGELARLYSVDPASNQQGGDLGYFTRENMVRELSDAAFTMDLGRTSDPVRSQYGWHIILVKDRQGPGVLPFEKAKDDVQSRLLISKQEQAYQQWVSELERNAKITKVSVTSLK